MCISPKKIVNRSLHWDETKPIYMFVPCGKCDECKRLAQADWFVRCYYEWQNNFTSTFFYTLTYDNEHLPTFGNIPVFSKRDIQLFIKRLRKRLSPRGISLKYLITCEFGELRKRPHYHALFFLDKHYTPYLLYKDIEESWKNGFVKYGDNLGLVNSCSGIKYVTKYITKDFSHIDNYLLTLSRAVYSRYTKLFDYIEERYGICPYFLFMDGDTGTFTCKDIHHKPCPKDSKFYDFCSHIVNKMNDIVRSRIPFHLQSTKLGANYKDLAKSVELEQGVINLLGKNSNIEKYRLPRYYKRMFWYDVIENETDGKRNKFILNEDGKKHILSTIEKTIERNELDYVSISQNTHLIDSDTLSLVNCSLPKNVAFASVYDLSYYLRHIDIDFHALSIYASVFRNRYMPIELLNEYIDGQTLKDNYFDYLTYCLYETSNKDYGKIYEKFGDIPSIQAFELISWNAHPNLNYYERICTILDACSICIRQKTAKCSREQEQNVRKLRQFLESL